MTLKEFMLDAFSEVVKAGGTLAPAGQGEARINVCRTRQGGAPCEFIGEVEPVPGLRTEGCTACGCPFATKPHMLTFVGRKITCPHPEGNEWADVDKKFQNEKPE